MRGNPRFRFFVFTCREVKTDFRAPLVAALRRREETYYIWLRRRPIITDGDGRSCEMTPIAFLLYMFRLKRDGVTNVYINSTNTSFPISTVLLRWLAPGGLWCLDMHDDLRYHFRGLKRLHAILAVRIMRRFSDMTFHAAATLVELFPDSYHLGNAFHILPLIRTDAAANEVLVIASFDERFDFDLMGQVAANCPATIFHVYGKVTRNLPAIQRQLDNLVERHANIIYHGAYDLDSLPNILVAYRVSFAPYRPDSILTRYIDPLRYYHCLNSGMEVITTAHPQALAMQDVLHIVHNAAEFAAALSSISERGFSKLANYAPITWEQRVEQFLALIRHLSGTKVFRLCAEHSS